MGEKKKPGAKRFKFIFFVLVSIFGCLYFASITGYYNKKISTDTVLTSEAIKAFEEDVLNGKPVDIKDYIKAPQKDYQNLYSRIGNKFSKTVSLVLNDGVGYIIEILKSLFS